MNSSKFLLIVLLTLAFSVWNPGFSQYNISTNNKIIVAELAENRSGFSAQTTAEQFLILAGQGRQNDWEELLSGKCFYRNEPGTHARQWYETLHSPASTYSIIKEGPSTRNDQKVFYIGKSESTDAKKHLILVKERGEWKVLYAKL